MAQGHSRRLFLSQAAVVAPTAMLVGAGSAEAASAGDDERRVVPARPGAPFSRAVSIGNIVFCAGVVGRKPDSGKLASTDFQPQCRQVFENLKASVEASGSEMSKVLKCTCFLTDVADFPVMNNIFRSFFASNPPARSTVVVKELVVPNAKIEVDCVTSL